MTSLSGLCIHGAAHMGRSHGWFVAWQRCITGELQFWRPGLKPAMTAHELTKLDRARMPKSEEIERVLAGRPVRERAGSGAVGARVWREVPEAMRWRAGCIAQWVADGSLRLQLRKRLIAVVEKQRPDFMVASGIGALVVYDAFAREATRDLIAGTDLITFANPLGNAAVRATFGGHLGALAARRWFNVFDHRGADLSSALRHVIGPAVQLGSGTGKAADAQPHFREIELHLEGNCSEENAADFLGAEDVRYGAWRVLARTSPMPYDRGGHTHLPPRSMLGDGKDNQRRTRSHRALVIGIDAYPNQASRLSGCVNDAYVISELLQETGFPASGIRLLLDDRATADAIRTRMEWLLGDSPEDSARVLYFAGHGARIASYGIGEVIDSLDECLVPYDFDWSMRTALTDDWFYDLYSQLSYSTHFVAVFDCCHSGGMARSGAGRVRGLNPPGDIRHRSLEWKGEAERPAGDATRNGWAARYADHDSGIEVHNIGEARQLRLSSRRVARDFGHLGPYKPTILKACTELEQAEEIQIGSVTYGVFTYALAKVMRSAGGSALAVEDLIGKVNGAIRQERIRQTASADAPSAKLKLPAFPVPTT